jgi:hypothetical protein
VRALVALCLLMVCAPGCQQRPDLHVRKRRLTRLPIAWRRPSIHVGRNGDHVTYTVRDGDGYYVMTPNGRGPRYVDVSLPLLAPDSDRVFYWGTREENGRTRYDVVADGRIVPTRFVAPGDLVSAPGGRRWAARGEIADDASESADRRAFILVDGREFGPFVVSSRPSFSHDGAHVAWLAQPDGERTIAFVDGAPVRTFDRPPVDAAFFDRQSGIGYLPDGRLLALAPDGGGWALYRDDERVAAFAHSLVPGSTMLVGPDPDPRPSIAAPSIVIASDAATVVWWERLAGFEERWRVVRDGAPIDDRVCSSYWETQTPVVTADGSHVAYVCVGPPETGIPLGYRWIVRDGRRFGPYTESWTLGLADDGGTVAYGAAESLPVTTWRIFADGEARSEPADLVWRPRFSPDGRHLFWAAGPEHGRRRLVMDGRTVTRFDDVLSGPEFPTSHTATWAIRRGRAVAQIQATF